MQNRVNDKIYQEFGFEEEDIMAALEGIVDLIDCWYSQNMQRIKMWKHSLHNFSNS